MAIAADFAINSTTKVISYTGAAHAASGAGYYTVLELHRWLQDLADDAGSSGDDYMDISRATPSDKQYDTIITLVNGYTIDAAASEHLYAGSIIQGSGGTEEIFDGVQVIAGSGAHIQVIQNGAVLSNDFWNSVPFGTGIKGLNPDAANGIACRFMLKVRTAGADIDGRRLLLQTREFGFTYTEFKLNGTGRGINVAALTYASDLNNQTASGTVAGWSDVTNLNAGYIGIDVNADSTNEFYYSKWDRGSRSINQFYERMKYLTRRGETTTLYGLAGHLFRGITHEVAVGAPRTSTIAEGAAASWTGGTGQVLARDNAGTATKLWIQLLTGVAPTAGQTITVGGGSVTAGSGTPSTERTLSFPFCGVSTGSAIIGAYGFSLEAADLSVNDKVFDLTNTLRNPPNLVTFTVSGLVSGEDYILVGPGSSGALLDTQFTLNGALTGAAVTSVVVNEAIPADTPTSAGSTGSIRIKRANGAFSLHRYTAYNAGTKTFTIPSHDFSSNNAPNASPTFLGYIDVLASATTAAFQSTYVADRELFVRRRDGGVTPTRTFETAATLGVAGGSVAVQRLSDA